ncbi:toprim domain-containing protein [Desulfogranum marinum]|uniref:toprim domain-containing protein n=1 Tax=Desulfogranum marinum TaxID=453220 RepID=UPI001966C12F|nr:toprim domain-containing protein [Desulfogranum marinum]MBM9515038.1 toprim domain-containing protein [Desulfogranum marinum]
MSLAHQIAQALYPNGKVEGTGNGGYVTCCPCHGDKHPSMSIWDDGKGSVNVDCKTGCNWKDIKDELVNRGLLPEWKPDGNGSKYTTPLPPPKPKDPPTPEKPCLLWKIATRDPWDKENIKKYFANRAITIDPLPVPLKWNVYKGEHMIVAAATKPGDTAVYGVQRLFIDPDTHLKTPNRKGLKEQMWGKCGGGGVWFHRKENKSSILVGEGIETTLSAMQATGKNGVAALSALGMQNIVIPDETEALYILVDSDTTSEIESKSMIGQHAAYVLAERFAKSGDGKQVFFITPDNTCFSGAPKYLDFNDLLQADPSGESIRARFNKAIKFEDLEWRPIKSSTDSLTTSQSKTGPVDAASLLRGFQVTKEYTDKLGKEKFLIDNLIISNHVATIIAMSGGGKTAFFFRHVAPILAKEGLTVWYCDNDSPASEHEAMREAAEAQGFTFLNPDTVVGQSAETLLATLVHVAESGSDLSGYVFIMDTLKKFCDMMGKKDIKEFYKLARKLTALGATVVLLGHANKYRDKDGNLIFEGTGDVKADSDELIYLESVKNSSGGIDVTTICDPDKGAKVRGIFKPFSFNISPERKITFYDNALEVIDLSEASAPKATDDEILTVAEQYLKDRGEPVIQTELVEYAHDMIEGTAGKERVRKLIVKRAVLKDKVTTKVEMPLGAKFVFSGGARGKRLFELPPEPPKPQPVFGETTEYMPMKNELLGHEHQNPVSQKSSGGGAETLI